MFFNILAAAAVAVAAPGGSTIADFQPSLAADGMLPTIVAPRGTPVRLMVLNEVSTKTAQVGDLFTLLVDAPVKVGDRMIIAQGVRATGKVVDAAESGIAGKSGKLATRLLYLDLDGVRIPLDGDPRSAGRSGTVQVVLATLALTPWGLFARGNNAKLKAGDIVIGTLAEDYAPPTRTHPTPPVLPSVDPVPPS